MKSDLPDCHEGLEASRSFDSEVSFLLSVPRSTIQQREKEYQEQVQRNPNKRGPKRKVKPSVSPGLAS